MSYRLQRPAWAAVALLIACGLGGTVPATEFFFDNFDGYADDTELTAIGGWETVEVNTPIENAAWTIMNPGGRGNPPTANGAPSTGLFLISDSDAAQGEDTPGSGMSHDIWSPPFSTTGASTVWLHMDALIEMNNNGLCVFDVDVSTDNGTTWANVFRRVAPNRGAPFTPAVSLDNADGFFGRLDIDISAQAANKPSVRFRLRQFEPNDDWWFAVDNITVDDVPVKGGDDILLCERFDSGIPDSWQIVSNAVPPNTGGQTWNSSDLCNRSIARTGKKLPSDQRLIAHLDDGFAIMDSDCDPDPADDELLITPPINCTSASKVFLHFRSEIVPTDDVQEVLLSLDGGSNFETTPILSYHGIDVDGDNIPDVFPGFAAGEDPFYNEFVFEVPAAAGKPQVAFAWHYASGGDAWYWAIDDVKVSAAGPASRNCCSREFVVGKFNSGSSSISMSWRNLPGDQGFRILANGAQVGPDLPASASSFTDNAPPAGSACITYSLQSLSGGNVEFECTGPCTPVVACPTSFVSCVNQATKAVTLSWTKGVNVAGNSWRISRNGVPITTQPLNTTSYVDSAITEPGTYEYQLTLNGGSLAQCPDLPLKATAVVLGGDLIFFDDFDCYQNDGSLTAAGWQIHEENDPLETGAAWTIQNFGGRASPPALNGIPSQGKFLVSDSDYSVSADGQGSGRSHDIWSPRLDCTGKTKVWLHADGTIVLNNNGLVVVDVDVSSDDGASWVNLFRRVGAARSVDPLPLADIPEDLPGGPQAGNADGFFGRLDLDLSAQAAQKPNVRFRLRQFEPDDDWWVAFDNILVDSNPAPSGSRVILDEDFSGGIPADWNIKSLDDMSPWRAEDPCNVSLLNSNGGAFPDAAAGRQIHHFDSSFALVFGDVNCAQVPNDETLGTRSLDCSGTTKVFLHFKSDILVVNQVAEVLLSLDGGATYDTANPVFSYQLGGGFYRDAGNAETSYNEYNLEVPQAAGQSKVVFGFHYANPGTSAAYWGIDDVKVTAEGGGGKTFHRGDSDNNGQLQLTDAVRILGFLFLGGVAPTCLDAADADGNNTLQLTDAVRILGFLFLGGLPPASPGPPPQPCGLDSDTTHLGCELYDKC